MPPETATDPGPTLCTPTFRFGRLMVRRASFEEVDRKPRSDGEVRPNPLISSLDIAASILISNDGQQALVTLDVTVRPDLKWQPYRVQVVIAGLFHAQNATAEQFHQFCQRGVPPILFPYVRETVHRLTADGLHGPLRIDPINISELLNRSAWTEEPAADAGALVEST
jgi:preprotein translocase subunit SecB